MEDTFVELIRKQHNPENSIRASAESEFSNLVQQDPSQCALILIKLACNHALPTHIRQASILHLKRLVPRYWSMGFQTFTGPPISQEVKSIVRETLLNFSTLDQDSKIRSSAAYCIVQIAATDYPDEWPDLLNQLFEKTNHLDNEIEMLGGLDVLSELFDDLVTEEQFFEGGVGQTIIEHTMRLLSSNQVKTNVKIKVASLYKACLSQFQGPETFATPQRNALVEAHIPHIIHLATNLLNDNLDNCDYSNLDVDGLLLRTELYKIITILLTHFKKWYPEEAKIYLQNLITKNLTVGSKTYVQLVVLSDKTITLKNCSDSDITLVWENLVIEIFQTLGSLYNLHLQDDSLPEFIDNLMKFALLPLDKQEQWTENFNSFVSDASGLSSKFTARDGINEYLSELRGVDSFKIFQYLLTKFGSYNEKTDWQSKESLFFMFESLFLNEEANLSQNVPVAQFLNKLITFLKDENLLVRARVCLMLPRFLEKYIENLSSESFGSKTFMENLTTGYNDKSELVRSASLIASTYYKHILDLDAVPIEAQNLLINIITSLVNEAEEDTASILLEALTTAIEINSKNLIRDTKVLEIIFQISFSDPSNVQLVIESKESLRALLSDVDSTTYTKQCENGLPSLIQTIQKNVSGSTSVEYSSELDLTLEFLAIFINKSPEVFPQEVFDFIFPALSQLLINASDDQILQSGGEVFNEMLRKTPTLIVNYKNASNENGMDIVLRIVAKFLSPDLSDSAAMNIGSIVVSLVEKFQNHLGAYLPQILEASTRRLITAEKIITIEDLITVFCYLVLISPEDTVNFLASLQIDQKSGLEIVFPIWFQSYEVTRGYEKIKKNTLALGKLFSLGDARVESLIVDGDLVERQISPDIIITRSMASSMPQEYKKISASLKILKLLLSELHFQSQQPNASDYLPDNIERVNSADDAEEGWEDLDDIGVPDYEKLKSYIDSDNEGDERDQQNGDDGLREILIQFFKECAIKNLGNFKKYYELLDSEDKKFLTENVIF